MLPKTKICDFKLKQLISLLKDYSYGSTVPAQVHVLSLFIPLDLLDINKYRVSQLYLYL